MKNSKREQALAALIEYPTVRAAAVASNIPERTLWRFLEQEDFSAQLDSEKQKLVSAAADRLRGKLEAATGALVEVLEDGNSPPQTRVSASRTILEFTLKYTEMADIVSRLDALERQIAAESGT